SNSIFYLDFLVLIYSRNCFLYYLVNRFLPSTMSKIKIENRITTTHSNSDIAVTLNATCINGVYVRNNWNKIINPIIHQACLFSKIALPSAKSSVRMLKK